MLARARATDRLTLALTGWILSCAVFLVIGVLTPVDMRHYLAAVPAARDRRRLRRRVGLA